MALMVMFILLDIGHGINELINCFILYIAYSTINFGCCVFYDWFAVFHMAM